MNKKVVNFLDITLDLDNNLYKPFMKENNTILYINKKSNHPPSALKNIQENVTNRISRNSANQEIFNSSIQPYKDALIASGYEGNISYDNNVKQQQLQPQQQKRKNRSRKITWFNPPFSLNVKTNIGKIFLQILKECFPKNHILYKICNKNTIKISYRTMPNMNSYISKHNNKILQQNLQPHLQPNLQHNLQQNLQQQQNQNLTNKELEKRGAPFCNCINKANCPMPGKCKNSNVVYRYRVTQTDTGNVETYTGCTVGFKVRHNQHMG